MDLILKNELYILVLKHIARVATGGLQDDIGPMTGVLLNFVNVSFKFLK